MTRTFVAGLAALIAIGLSTQAPTVTTSHPFTGITYVDRTEATPRALHVHVVQIDLTTPGLRVALSPRAGTKEVVRQTTLEYLNALHAQVAINAHYFWPWPTSDTDVDVIGLAVSDGRVVSGFETPLQRYALVADAPAINVDASNHAAIVHRDAAAGDPAAVRERVTLWTALAGSAQIVTDGRVTIPTYADASHPDAALVPGGPNDYSNGKSWYAAVNARTAIGLSRDARTLTLFTVDVRGGSTGLTVADVAERLIRDFDVWNALNLDGGGSTSMAMEDPLTHIGHLVNVSSDNPAGRSVGSNFAVFVPH